MAIFVFLAFSLFSRKLGRQSIERWAMENEFHIISIKRRTFVPFLRPFSGKGFQFFHVAFRDARGIEQKVWMRLESDCPKPEILDVAWEAKTIKSVSG